MANEGKKADAKGSKQSLYFPNEVLADMKNESARLDRSLSWTLARAWAIAKADIAKMQSVSSDE